ncbi:MAG: cupin domain-containing protein [Alphaproteobacteria bacterium]|nr:cupin domain-containing protein [Alphaproteobacteria bacterium]
MEQASTPRRGRRAAGRRGAAAPAAAGPATGSGAPQVPARGLAQALGAQIRRLRRRQQMTGAELAAQAGVVPGTLSKVENGTIQASIATPEAVADALAVPLSSLFAKYEEQRDCAYVPAGTGVGIERRGTRAGHRYELLGHTLGRDIAVEPYLITLARDATPYPGFRHEGIEFIYMLEGEVGYRHDEKVMTLKPGDALFFDAGAPHGPEDLRGLPARFLSVIVYPRER